MRVHAANLALARAGALAFHSSGPTISFFANDRYLDPIHQLIHFQEVLFDDNRQNQLLGAADLLRVTLGDMLTNRFRGALNCFRRNPQPRSPGIWVCFSTFIGGKPPVKAK